MEGRISAQNVLSQERTREGVITVMDGESDDEWWGWWADMIIEEATEQEEKDEDLADEMNQEVDSRDEVMHIEMTSDL